MFCNLGELLESFWGTGRTLQVEPQVFGEAFFRPTAQNHMKHQVDRGDSDCLLVTGIGACYCLHSAAPQLLASNPDTKYTLNTA